MRRVILSILFAGFLASPLMAQDQAARDVISDQIAAFRAEDPAGAFGYASPFIRDKFGTPERFGQMVREGYPMVWRPAEVQYLELRTEGGFPAQRVLITDENGASHLLEYRMIPAGDGWQIGGVRILQAAGVGA